MSSKLPAAAGAATQPTSLGPIRRYWALTRTPRYSILFVAPLLLLYEGMAAVLEPATRGPAVRNGADVLLTRLFVLVAGYRGPLVFGALGLGFAAWLVARDWRRHGGVRGGVFAGMLLESVVLASVFGVVVGTLTAGLLHPMRALSMQTATGAMGSMSVPTQVMLSLGAGLYEELLFRVILVSGLAWLATRGLGISRWIGNLAAAFIGAAIFSAFHYVGPYGDAFTLRSFTFRLISGLFFSVLYVTRGFGVDAWTHALYDVFLVLGA
jgi:Type II CAAX prenyl endopeptidase Rce1-like